MRYILILILNIILSLNAVTITQSNYIDIPTANFSDGIYINLNGNYPLRSNSDVGFDPNVWIGLTNRKINATLKWYNEKDFSLDIAYLILEGDRYRPSLALGMNDITYRKYISPIGYENTYVDERYDPRPAEIASAYIVTTWPLNRYFEITGGVGRGKFIGYGPRSRFLNLDIFFSDKHEDIIFGIFGGMKLGIPEGPSLIMETSGRDFNLGLCYELINFKGTIGFSKVEQFFTDESSELTSRFFAGLSYNVSNQKKGGLGKLFFVITDEKTGDAISSSAIIQTSGAKIVVEVLPDKTKYITLNSGVYMVTLVAPGYTEKRIKVNVKPGGEHYIISSLTLGSK